MFSSTTFAFKIIVVYRLSRLSTWGFSFTVLVRSNYGTTSSTGQLLVPLLPDTPAKVVTAAVDDEEGDRGVVGVPPLRLGRRQH